MLNNMPVSRSQLKSKLRSCQSQSFKGKMIYLSILIKSRTEDKNGILEVFTVIFTIFYTVVSKMTDKKGKR